MKENNLDSESMKSREAHREVETTPAQGKRILRECKKEIYVLVRFYKKLNRLLEQVFKRGLWRWGPPSGDTEFLYLRLCRAIENRLRMLEQHVDYLVKTGCLTLDERSKAINNKPDVRILIRIRKMKCFPFERIVNVSPADWEKSGRHICSAFLRKIKELWRSFGGQRKITCSILDTDELELLEMVKRTVDQYKQVSKERMNLLKYERKSGIRKPTRAVLKFPTPPNTTWDKVKIQFISECSVRIMIGSVQKTYTYEQIGFKDNRKIDSPDKQWEFLRYLAQSVGKLSWQEELAIPYPKKRIQEIRKRLRTFMGLEDDPFFPYGTAGCYRIPKFKIQNRSL
ncbi:MAG: hypothetical protein ACETWM_18950 [Candidatus Lokiarchaeia archaeon]